MTAVTTRASGSRTITTCKPFGSVARRTFAESETDFTAAGALTGRASKNTSPEKTPAASPIHFGLRNMKFPLQYFARSPARKTIVHYFGQQVEFRLACNQCAIQCGASEAR